MDYLGCTQIDLNGGGNPGNGVDAGGGLRESSL